MARGLVLLLPLALWGCHVLLPLLGVEDGAPPGDDAQAVDSAPTDRADDGPLPEIPLTDDPLARLDGVQMVDAAWSPDDAPVQDSLYCYCLHFSTMCQTTCTFPGGLRTIQCTEAASGGARCECVEAGKVIAKCSDQPLFVANDCVACDSATAGGCCTP